jgi:hypothetical protein
VNDLGGSKAGGPSNPYASGPAKAKEDPYAGQVQARGNSRDVPTRDDRGDSKGRDLGGSQSYGATRSDAQRPVDFGRPGTGDRYPQENQREERYPQENQREDSRNKDNYRADPYDRKEDDRRKTVSFARDEPGQRYDEQDRGAAAGRNDPYGGAM